MFFDDKLNILLIASISIVLTVTSHFYHAYADARPLNRELEVEELGAPVQRRRLTMYWIFENPTTDNLHLLVALGANNGWQDDPENHMVDFNITTGEIRSVITDYSGYPGGGWLHTNGKLYIRGTRPPSLLEYDPNKGEARVVGDLSEGFIHAAYSIDLAPDGWFYFGHYGTEISRYNPETDETENFGPVTGDIQWVYIYTIAADGRYVYCSISGSWHLAVYDTETGERHEYPDITGGSRGVRHDADGNIYFGNRLMRDGKPVPEDEIDKAKQLATPTPRNPVMDFSQASGELGIEFDVSDMHPTNFNDGRVAVRWRKEDDDKWHELVYEGVDLVPNTVRSMTSTSDGTLIGQGSSYGPMFEFVPDTRESKYLGPGAGHVYGMLSHGDYTYFAGYRSQFWVYDRTKPFTLVSGAAEYRKGAEPNPVNIGGPGIRPNLIDIDYSGRIIAAGNHGRHTVGGDAKIYDPATGEEISLRAELEPYNISDMVALEGGERIVWSARHRDEGSAHLIVYDAKSDEFAGVRDIEFSAPGNMIAIGSDRILGVIGQTGRDELGNDRQETFVFIMGVDSGEVLSENIVAGRPFAGPLANEFRGVDRDLVAGPDGCGWLFIDNNLSRIHPDGTVEKVLEMEHGARLVFLDDDIYLYNGGRRYFGGFAQIIRIGNVFE